MVFTNASAQTALRTLRTATENLDRTQNRISTGLKVSRPDDNPAFFLVAATQKSDIVKLQGARDNLTYALGAVRTALSAQSFIDNAIQNIRSAVIATETGTAQDELSAVIEAQIDTVRQVLSGTSFNGANLLEERDRFIFDAGVQRTANGGLRFDQFVVDGKGLGVRGVPIDTTAPPFPGAVQDLNSQNLFGAPGQLAGLTPANSAGINVGSGGAGFAKKTFAISFETGADINSRQIIYEQGGNVRGLNIFVENGNLAFGAYNLVTSDPTPAWPYVEVQASLEPNTRYTAQLVIDGNGANNGFMRAYLNGELVDERGGVGILYDHPGGIGVGRINGNAVLNGTVANYSAATEFQGNIDKVVQYNEVFFGPDFDQIQTYLAEGWLPERGIQYYIGSETRQSAATLVDLLEAIVPLDQDGFSVPGALEVLDAAQEKSNLAFTELGIVESRIIRQRGYLSDLTESMQQGVAALIEADLAEESAKVQAFQVQTQLAQQSLVIANRRPETVLRLFS
ncbi:MAG: flagellin [Pseudomonadota bacterium]